MGKPRSREYTPTPTGTAMRSLRAERDLSLAELSKLSGVPITTLQDYETGRYRSYSTGHVTAMAKGYGLSVKEFRERVDLAGSGRSARLK